MKCSEFERWLDEGMPENQAARLHAASCPSCAAQLHTAERLDDVLSDVIPAHVAAPARFTDAVMERVAHIETMRPALAAQQGRDAFPWWVRAAAEPSIAVALTLSALLLWQSPAILTAGSAAFAWIARFNGSAIVTALRGVEPQATPLVMFGLGLAVLPAAWWLANVVYRWTDRVFEHATMPVLRRGR